MQTAPMKNRWNPFLKQLVIVVSLIAAVWLIYRLRVMIAPLVLALLLAYLVSLPVGWVLRRFAWRRTPVIIITEIATLALLLSAPAVIVPWLVNALSAFATTSVSVVQELLEATPKPISITPSLTIDLGPYYEPINRWLQDLVGSDLSLIQNLQRWLGLLASSAAGVLRGAVNGLLWAFVVLVVTFYVVRDAPKLGWMVPAWVPPSWRSEMSQLWQRLVRIWDSFVRGQFILGLIIGIVVWAAMTLLGVRNAPALGLISGLLEFVPAIGPVIAAVPGILFALVFGSSWLSLPNIWFALLVTLVYVLIQQIENLYLLPRIVGSRVKLHPAVVIVGALAGSQLGGVLGILLAAPAIAAFRVVAGYVFRKLLDEEAFPEIPPPPDRAELWPALVQEAQVQALLFDLDGTLVETDDLAVQGLVARTRCLERLFSPGRREHWARRLLMAGELHANRLVTLLDRLKLDALVGALEGRMRWLTGARPLQSFAPVAGTPEALRQLAERYRLGVVTSRRAADAAAFVALLGLDDVFETVITRSDSMRLKPHPMPVRMAADRLGVQVNQCVVVGDTSMDVRAAKKAGALAVGVRCGFGEEADFADADLVLESPVQLTSWL